MKKTVTLHANPETLKKVLGIVISKLDKLIYSKRQSYAIVFEFNEDDGGYETTIGLICSSIYSDLMITHHDDSIVIVKSSV